MDYYFKVARTFGLLGALLIITSIVADMLGITAFTYKSVREFKYDSSHVTSEAHFTFILTAFVGWAFLIISLYLFFKSLR